MQPETPSFRELYHLVKDYSGLTLYDDVLLPWLSKAQQAMGELTPYRKRNTPDNPYKVEIEDLWQWYALNRVNDYLLLRFQMPEEHFTSQEWLRYQTHTRFLKPAWKHKIFPSAVLTWEQYCAFFNQLGFEIVTRLQFHPFSHEIVEVTEVPELERDEILIEEVCWENVMFGEMLFSRSGVRIWSHPETISKAIAERSTLYFTYWRYERETQDQSYGWGSNSQWRTCFRRDYEESEQFCFNVDGIYFLDEDYPERLPQPLREALDDLTLQERRELLIHRCFVTCPKAHSDCYPYQDTWMMPREEKK
jgi:hypothetical protein